MVKYAKLEENEVEIEEKEEKIVKIISTNSIEINENEEKIVKKDEGFPRVELLMAYLLVIGDSIALSVSGPFIPEMCATRFGIPEAWIGIASGLINGIYSFAMFLSSFYLGHVSDEHGRKPVLLFGSGIGAITTILFGLSPTFQFALLMRLIGGITCSNVAVTKAVIADVTADKPQYRVQAYGYHGASFSAARALSGALSGLTAGVLLTTDSKWGWFSNNPYALPGITGGAILAISFFGALFLLRESNIRAVPFCSSRGKSTEKNANTKSSAQKLKDGLKTIWKDKFLRKLNVIYCINSFANGGILTAMPLFWSTSIENSGLGFTSFQNGIAFAIFGGMAVIYQVGFFPYTMKLMNQKKAYLFSSKLFVLSTPLYPLCSFFFKHYGVERWTIAATWTAMSFVMLLSAIAFMLGLPLMSSMISNVSDPRRQGLVIGTAQSLSSFLRSFGPIISGGIFSLSTIIKFPSLSFIFLTVLYLTCGVMAFFFSEEEVIRLESPPKRAEEFELEEQQASKEQAEKSQKRVERKGLLSEEEEEEQNPKEATIDLRSSLTNP